MCMDNHNIQANPQPVSRQPASQCCNLCVPFQGWKLDQHTQLVWPGRTPAARAQGFRPAGGDRSYSYVPASGQVTGRWRLKFPFRPALSCNLGSGHPAQPCTSYLVPSYIQSVLATAAHCHCPLVAYQYGSKNAGRMHDATCTYE